VERIVKAILLCAIRDGASDIHIEPESRVVTVRYRIKGVMRDHLKLPMLVLEPIAARFKTLGKLDPAARAAQWGIIRLRVDERDYDLQISTQPTEQGERIFLRLTSGLHH
jgi:type II secretory ATPase GspE/PulE/Tfp pilus assembly ATPase PilB-like protein